MPKAIVVISDMEIDYCGNREWSFYDKMANKFRKADYVIPNIIFWNVNSRHDVFHADHNRKGCAACKRTVRDGIQTDSAEPWLQSG